MEIIGLKLGDVRSNAYVVSEGKQCFIIDPGFEGTEIVDYIKSRKLEPQFIYITHGHHDHTGGVKQLKELYHIPVYAPLKDKIWMTDTIYNYWQYDISVDQFVVEDDLIEFGKHEFRVIETPGHSEGSTCLYSKPFLFSGDTLFFETIGRTDIPFANQDVLVDSIKNKLFTLPDDTICYPGHGKSTTIKHEKANNQVMLQLMQKTTK
ncbi:hydroxyacylglutathione hydrolase [Acholeplasma oculi]|uniref:Metallo-beta-lactamase superfamily protein n=1 Tax=Acholeplasma oculi TaxID=35623 RepID=A0A061AHZ2_9MOLU|nr:MBL fold metallo-hydrolase [Acholeplasma oculi]CDR30592.1 Metallo-beta-lactamase superfamily protein [Acholeplasma oculi]SKC46514.1 Glyoxylase, beta-lactamase superfamily II [Acholeplasma oculi]SUT89298.1 hydroxyacylglutathione hydrolase [Acholeplasma oculi]